uniref:DUF7086 domain-containing protein n=2 Tax=Oryza glaberrima TaxID=4538 RepID=I1PXN5_ORYGL
MGREAPSPPPARDAGSSSGQKRKAFTMVDQDGGSEDTWLKLSLGPVIYTDATNVDDSPVTTTLPKELPPPPPAVGPPIFMASATTSLIDHGKEAARMATDALFNGDAAGSSSLHHESSSARHPTQRRSTASTTSSTSGSAGDVPAITGDGTNGGSDGNNGAAGTVNNDRVLVNNPPYPWATNRVAVHHSLVELSRRGIFTIKGEARCRRCDVRKEFVYDIEAKFRELEDYLRRNCMSMNDRASERWKNPIVPNCDGCGQQNCMRPVIAAEKERINWLFLLLGETLGLCTLDQLKFFCAHTNQHRTGAKDRVLYSTYLELCNQLVPGIMKPFEKKAGHNQLRIR